MPLPMVHLGTARVYAKGFPTLSNCPEFYLGCISPDAIHMRENVDKKDKRITHLHEEGNEWKSNVISFLKQNRYKQNYNFLLGYGIHILTDIIWWETVYIKFKQEYVKDQNPVQDLKLAYYNDTDQLDFELYKNSEWRESIWNLLKKSESFSVEGLLEISEITAWKSHTLKYFDTEVSMHKNPIRYFTIEELEVFMKDAAGRIKDILEEEGL
jgi:hypothetical protein